MKKAKIAEVGRSETNVPVGIDCSEFGEAAEGLNKHLALDVLGWPQAVVDALIARGH